MTRDTKARLRELARRCSRGWNLPKRDTLWLIAQAEELRRLSHALPEQAATVEAWEALNRERDDLLATVKEYDEDVPEQEALIERLERERDEAQTEAEKLPKLIHALTDSELEWLEILGRGVDFDHPEFAVEHHALRLDGSESHKRFEGKNLLACLEAALARTGGSS